MYLHTAATKSGVADGYKRIGRQDEQTKLTFICNYASISSMKFQRFCLFTLLLLMAVSATAQQPDSPQQPQRIIRVSSGVAEGLLKHKVEPQYPQEAKFNNITGDVLLQIIIDREGNVAKIKAISGHPVLTVSAIEAVRQWKYKPYLLNGSPEVVETTVTIKYHTR